MDVVEVAPSYDISEITAIAAATFFHDFICLQAEKKGLNVNRLDISRERYDYVRGIMTAAVELKGITKKFGDVIAVDNVDLTIEDGEFFSCLAQAGVGKPQH